MHNPVPRHGYLPVLSLSCASGAATGAWLSTYDGSIHDIMKRACKPAQTKAPDAQRHLMPTECVRITPGSHM